MRKIIVEIEAGERCCYNCVIFNDNFFRCDLFWRKLKKSKYGQYLRLRECLEAEKKSKGEK